MPGLQHRAAHFMLKKLGFFNRSYREIAYGRAFEIPIVNGRKTYISEPWLADLLRVLFQLKEGAFIDVGVNLGQTMLKVAAIDSTREYLGFEPNPACADYAASLAAANSLAYTVIPAGIGTATEILMLQMYRSEDTDPSASLVPSFRGEPLSRKPVIVLSLADVPADLLPAKVSVIKIDVEGGELPVLEALTVMIRDQRPFVVVEILPAYSRQNQDRISRQVQIENLLRSERYTILRVRYGPNEELVAVDQIDEIGIQDDLAMSDYLLCPEEDTARLLWAIEKAKMHEGWLVPQVAS
ncbi:FkbM family methyltransferase [Altererythrobacter sp. SALINAS58]|uniref:FkbM family methyltransferase n=1 Tax=Alteripontixanthobacter muriae TaxID=2705546 RepID=UPI0015759709|nr:FkbM family methyltransferase [Alteripontixanthobacter muriae]NTZ43958.1 FkbM family methyltransferase [Alteripontixanthobacter muriae]